MLSISTPSTGRAAYVGAVESLVTPYWVIGQNFVVVDTLNQSTSFGCPRLLTGKVCMLEIVGSCGTTTDASQATVIVNGPASTEAKSQATALM